MTTPLQTDGEIKGMSNGKTTCDCEWCVKWSPLFRRMGNQISEPDRVMLDEYLLKQANDSDELCCANSKLSGEWPGWEWMKEAVNQKCYHVT